MGATCGIGFPKLIFVGIFLTSLTSVAIASFQRSKYRSIPLHEHSEHFTPVYRCGEIGKDLVSNFVNRNYPENDNTPGDCRFRLIVTNPNVCQVRVDFVDTELLPPVKGDCLSQQFEVEGAVWPTGLPPLCGVNTDQHFYLHLEPWNMNLTWIDFRVSTVIGGKPYRFGVWITQVDCSGQNLLKAPEGCTQYYLAERGIIRSFNYEGHSYLHGQNYRICIRATKGACNIIYDAGPEDFNIRKSTWPITKEIQYQAANGDEACALDYLIIPHVKESRRLPRKRTARFFFRRKPNPLVIINTMAGKPTKTAVQAKNPAKTPLQTTTTSTTTVKSLNTQKTKSTNKNKPTKIQTQLKSGLQSQHVHLPNPEKFCGGTLSPVAGEMIPKPVSASVRSNLIYLQFVSMSTASRKKFKQTKLLNTTTRFRITYAQSRLCDTSEVDLVSQGNLFSVLHAMGGSDEKEYYHVSPPMAAVLRDREMLMESTDSVQVVTATTEGYDPANMTATLPNNDIDPEDSTLWDYLGDSESAEDSKEDETLYDFLH